ncbi:cellulase [Streptomyces sp. NPDC059861]|uniref:cellulase n=1 Tax=Streptomyces sp. NPDC059861 TaxID=3346974 RepID=UPI0036637EE2
MDHFERRLARMMRESEEHSPFGPRHRQRIREGVRARRRVRAAQRAAGSVLAVAGLAVGLLLLPGGPDRAEPAGPSPRPEVSPVPTSPGPTRAPDGSAGEPSSPPTPTSPALPGGPIATTTPPYSTSHPPSGTPHPTSRSEPPGAPTSTALTGP